MQPVFSVLADGKDITALINDRLLQLRTTDKPGLEADEFELRIDARNGVIALPARGALIDVSLGHAGRPLTRLGRYTVDEVELAGPPDTLVIRGKASDVRGSGKTIRSGSWEDATLQRIVTDIAARNGWQAACPVTSKIPESISTASRTSISSHAWHANMIAPPNLPMASFWCCHARAGKAPPARPWRH